jgi:hydrophobic/amphiphilic exporter-1 (mainly G- bacteria), HAE1 family
MSVSKTVVGRPTTIFIIFVLLIGLGIYSTTDLAIDLYPEIEPPILVVFTGYEGAGPEEIEKRISRPLEGSLSNVSNVESISSTSSEGSSMIMVEFTYGTNMAEAANSVRDNLEFIKGFLPDEADSPMIFKFDPSMLPIMGLTVTGNRTPEELRQIAEDIVQSRIEQIEGVALTSISGGRSRVIRVEIPQNRLEAYELTLTQISSMLRGQNVQVTAGNIIEGNINYLVTTSGEYDQIDQIKNTVISYKSSGGAAGAGGVSAMGAGGMSGSAGASSQKTIRLRDIANVFDGYRAANSLVYINGEPGIQITVQKQSGTNSVRTADNIRERLPRINKQVPTGITVKETFNTTDMIKSSLNQVSSSAITGAILAVIVLFVFLRSLKSTFIIGLTIPVSLVVTLMLMYFAGLTLNIMTLAGLALGIGMLVDNSIVILENIYRYREKGAKLTASAILGSQEMVNAIVASTLTTICVFAPVALFKSQLDVVGELLASLSFTVVISLSASLLVAITLIPVLSSHYLPLTSRKQKPLQGPLKWIDGRMEKFFRGLDKAYGFLLKGALRFKIIIILIVLGVFGFSLSFLPKAGFEFIPTMQEDQVSMTVELPVGTKLEITEQVLKQMEDIIRQEVKGYTDIITNVGESSFFGLGGNAIGYKGSIRVSLPPFNQRIESSDEIKQILRSHFNDFPSAVFAFGSNQGMTLGGADPIDIIIKTEDLSKAKDIGLKIEELLNTIPEITEPQLDLQDGLPQVEIVMDRDKMYNLGLNIYQVGQEIRANLDGINSGRFRDGGSEYDIMLYLAEEDRNTIPDLNKIFVNNQMGQRIPLASFAEYTKGTGPITINREGQARVVHVTAGTVPGTPLNEVATKAQRLIAAEIPAEEDVIIEFSGDYEDLQKYGSRFVAILLVSVFLVFGVMASQFESFVDPFIILFTIPLSLIGVIFIYVGTGQIFNILTAVGLVMLAGIIVNNGIVLVDYTNLLRKRGRSIHDACIEAGENRLRPILMTTLTTVLGLVPMAFFPGEGSELVQPIGKAVVGGLSVGSLLTLFLIPVIYAIFNGIGEKRMLKRHARIEKRRAARRLEAGQCDDSNSNSGAENLGDGADARTGTTVEPAGIDENTGAGQPDGPNQSGKTKKTEGGDA